MKKLICCLMIFFLFLIFSSICIAMDITLLWDAPDSPGLDKYYVFVSKTETYDFNNPDVIVPGNVTQAQIVNLYPEETYTIVVCARNIAGQLSEPSIHCELGPFLASDLCELFPVSGGPPIPPNSPGGCLIINLEGCP